jgi:hypothetical protein
LVTHGLHFRASRLLRREGFSTHTGAGHLVQ